MYTVLLISIERVPVTKSVGGNFANTSLVLLCYEIDTFTLILLALAVVRR